MKQRKLVDMKEWLFRRCYVTPEKKFMNPDGTATSRVFKLREKDNGELSVDVKSLTTPEKSISDVSKYMLFEISNISINDIGLKTYHDPLPDNVNDAHAVVTAMTLEDDITPGLLAKASRRVYLEIKKT